MSGPGRHADKAVPSDKSGAGAGVGADLGRSGVRRQQQAVAVSLPDPALGLCKNHSKVQAMHACSGVEVRHEECIVLSININAILIIIQSTVIVYLICSVHK